MLQNKKRKQKSENKNRIAASPNLHALFLHFDDPAWNIHTSLPTISYLIVYVILLCLLFLFFIIFIHFRLLYILHHVCILACEGWDIKPEVQLCKMSPFYSYNWTSWRLNIFSRNTAFILLEYNAVLTDCNIYLYLIMQRTCATLNTLQPTSTFHNPKLCLLISAAEFNEWRKMDYLCLKRADKLINNYMFVSRQRCDKVTDLFTLVFTFF